MRINVTNLKSFSAVAECGSFTEAAKRYGIAQPTLSRQVRELELRYGVELFDRSTRRVRLTPCGETLFRIASRAFGELAEADKFLRNQAKSNLVIYSVRNDALVRFLDIICTQFGGVGVSVEMKPSGDVYAGLKAGACDFGFLSVPEEGDRLEAIEIGTYPVLAIVSPRHPWAPHVAISVTQLEDKPILIGTRAGQTRRTFDREVKRSGVKVATIYEVDDYEVVATMAHAGRGIGIVGSTGASDPRQSEALRFTDPGMAQTLHLAISPAANRSALARSVFDLARGALRGGQP